MNTILIAIAKDVATYDEVQHLLSAHGVIKNTAEAPIIVLPKNMAQALTFADQIKPIIQALKVPAGSTFSARIYEVELHQLLNI